MPRKPRWYDAIGEWTAVVDCGGDAHPVTWRRGHVVLEAHDLAAERALLAFGGELCPCMRVLEMWAQQFEMPPELFAQMHTWLGVNAFLVPPEWDLPRKLSMILNWERLWHFESWLPSKQAALLRDELLEKSLPPLRSHLNAWKVKTGARVVAGCQVALLKSSVPAEVEGSIDQVAMRLRAQLHARWLVEVWPLGIANVDDAFVVELTEALTLDDLRVQALTWEQNLPGRWASVVAPARVWREPGAGGEWRLTWESE